MRRTYAYNGTIFGTLAGLAVLGLTENLALAIIALIVASALAFLVIRLFENLLYKGVEAAVQSFQKGSEKRRYR